MTRHRETPHGDSTERQPRGAEGGVNYHHCRYDYEAAFRAMESGTPGPVGGCLGCFRCRAGDHGTCHGCSCRCQGEWGGDSCPETCATWWHR